MPELLPYHEPALLRAVGEGNAKAFRDLYDHWHQKIFSFGFFLTKSQHLAEEITQEIFIKIWVHRHQLSELNSFEAWLKTVVRHHVYTVLNKLANEQLAMGTLRQQSPQHDTSTEYHVLERASAQLLAAAIDQLPPQQKTVYLLHRNEGMPHAAIAEAMGLSVHTVRNHFKAALASIRSYVGEHADAVVAVVVGSVFG